MEMRWIKSQTWMLSIIYFLKTLNCSLQKNFQLLVLEYAVKNAFFYFKKQVYVHHLKSKQQINYIKHFSVQFNLYSVFVLLSRCHEWSVAPISTCLHMPWATRLLLQWMLHWLWVNGSTAHKLFLCTTHQRQTRGWTSCKYYFLSSIWPHWESNPIYQFWWCMLNQLGHYFKKQVHVHGFKLQEPMNYINCCISYFWVGAQQPLSTPSRQCTLHFFQVKYVIKWY